MERLTYRTELGVSIDKNEDCPTCSICWNCDIPPRECQYISDALEKLAKYEDLEEQGRLIKLSCTTKDTVWHFCRELGQILEYKAYEVTIYSETPIYHCVAYSEGFPKDTLDEISVRTSEFGKSVFLTKSEAEARLKEPNYIEEVISQCPSSDFEYVGGSCPKCGEYVTSSNDFEKCHYCGKLLKWKKWDGAFKLY